MTETKQISQTSENKMGTMPVPKLLITMSLPMMISMLVQALYNIVDSMFVAMLNEDYQASSDKLLDSSIFGRKLGDVIQDGLKVKTNTLPEHTRGKVQQIVKTLANKGKTNVIAIVF